MNKDNQFKSSNFFMSEGDILHMIIIDEAGAPMTVDLQITPAPGEVISAVIGHNDWFLFSKDELKAAHDELHLYGLGGFASDVYWSSSENGSDEAYTLDFNSGTEDSWEKDISYHVRACRSFVSTDIGSLRENSPSGGLIFRKVSNPLIEGTFEYLETSPTDQSTSQVWSNVYPALLGTTGTATGTGQANTTAIIGQVGHTHSAAKLCDDLIL